MEPLGRLLDYLNTGDRTTFQLYDVKIHSVGPQGRVEGITRPEITVSSHELGLIHFTDADYRSRIEVLKHFDRVIAYTPHAILRGKFHRGVETRLGEMFDLMQGSFLAMTDVNIFPTAKLPVPFPAEADLLVVNRHYINLYHQE
jgi:hypothetical protein